MDAKQLYEGHTDLLPLDKMSFDHAKELARVVTQEVRHKTLNIVSINSRRIHYLDGSDFEGVLVDCYIRFDQLHPKHFLLLLDWGYDLFNLIPFEIMPERLQPGAKP